MRKIVIDTGSLQKIQDGFEAIKMLHDAGIRYYDLSLYSADAFDNLVKKDNYLEIAKQIRAYADSLKMKCFQSHAYFTSGTEQELIDLRIKYTKRDLEIAGIVGAKIVVIHPVWELSIDENVKFLSNFIELAHKYNIKIAIENVWGVIDNKKVPMCTSKGEGVNELLDKLHDKCFGMCLDIGHAEMEVSGTSAVEVIEKVNKRIITLHIHDNDTYADLHQIPYMYTIDYEAVLDALVKVGYKGNVVFEVERCYASLPLELYIPTIKYIHIIGKYFRNRLDQVNE